MTSEDDDVAAWAAARTLDDLGELTAQWLEGRRSYLPGYLGDAPEPETRDLVRALAAFNRAGFMTGNSQPGIPAGSLGVQRACVSGFCSLETAETLAFACLATDLVCLTHWPGATASAVVPVTIDQGRAFTWEGMPMHPESIIEQWQAACSPDGVLALVCAWQLAVVDPIWGRNDLLWTTLEEALRGPPRTGALFPRGAPS